MEPASACRRFTSARDKFIFCFELSTLFNSSDYKVLIAQGRPKELKQLLLLDKEMAVAFRSIHSGFVQLGRGRRSRGGQKCPKNDNCEVGGGYP